MEKSNLEMEVGVTIAHSGFLFICLEGRESWKKKLKCSLLEIFDWFSFSKDKLF